MPGNVAGSFIATPLGIILHSTRSTVARYSEREEWGATINYVRNGAGGLGWHATIGPGLCAIHMAPDQWGHNAREHSAAYIAIELAQSTVDKPISDAEVETAAWYIKEHVLPRWPALPMNLVLHSELPAGRRDGKTDAYAHDDPRGAELKQRLRRWLP